MKARKTAGHRRKVSRKSGKVPTAGRTVGRSRSRLSVPALLRLAERRLAKLLKHNRTGPRARRAR